MIGVFDSGIGGLSVASQIRNKLPNTSMIYIADHEGAPYGDKSADYILQRCRTLTTWLVEQGCEVIVVACNTATALTIDTLRREFSLSIVGVEPGVKPAAINSKSKSIGILATENTVASKRYRLLLESFLPEIEIHSQACKGLADAIEHNHPNLPALIKSYVEPLVELGVDHIVLGCTHYPLVANQVKKVAGSTVEVIDTGSAIAMEVNRRLDNNKVESEAFIQLYSTGLGYCDVSNTEQFSQLNWLNGYRFIPLSI